MHIKCLRRGRGSARAAVDYLVGERDADGHRREGVEVLRGNPDMVAAVADSLEFERKYTSVVIAWAPDDQPTEEQIEAVLDEFEKTAWAGLEPPGRPGAGQGAAAGPSRLHRGGEVAGRDRPRSRPARVDPRLPGAACRARRGAEPRRRGLRPGGSRLRSAAPGQELRHRPRSGQRKAVAAERSAVRG